MENKKILRVSTVAMFIDAHLNLQINMMVKTGLDVYVATSDPALNKPIDGITYYSIEIPREINLRKDLIALVKLFRLFKKEQFTIIHSTTPKAGLLCAIAGSLAKVPIVIHTYTGQRWATLTGIKKELVKLSDKVIGRLTNHCYADSYSQRDFLISEKIISARKISVVGKGSIAGVNLNRFNPENFCLSTRKKIKKDLSIPDNANVLLFVGRVCEDKGALELIQAFKNIYAKNTNLYLLLVGPYELNQEVLSIDLTSPSSKNIISTGYTEIPEQYMSIADILCIPSYREGFGSVVIEAAAMGVPSIGTNISGLSDAIVDGETGLLVNTKSSDELTSAIERLINNKKLLQDLGDNAQQRAAQYFSSSHVNKLVVDEYFKLLKKVK